MEVRELRPLRNNIPGGRAPPPEWYKPYATANGPSSPRSDTSRRSPTGRTDGARPGACPAIEAAFHAVARGANAATAHAAALRAGLTTIRGRRVSRQTFHAGPREPALGGVVASWRRRPRDLPPLITRELFQDAQLGTPPRRTSALARTSRSADSSAAPAGRLLTASWSRARRPRVHLLPMPPRARPLRATA